MAERRSPSSIVKKSTSCRKHTVPSNYRARLEDLSVITRDILKADGLQEMLRLTAGAASHVVHGCAGIAIYGKSAAWDAKTDEAIAEHISENVNISHFKNESFYNMLVKEKHSVCLKGKFFTDASMRQTLFHKRPTFRSLVGVPLLTNDKSDIQEPYLLTVENAVISAEKIWNCSADLPGLWLRYYVRLRFYPGRGQAKRKRIFPQPFPRINQNTGNLRTNSIV